MLCSVGVRIKVEVHTEPNLRQKSLKTFACWVPCVRSPKCHAKESQSSHHLYLYLCPLQLIWQEIHGETAIARHLWRLPCSETYDILILVSIHRCSLDLKLFKSCTVFFGETLRCNCSYFLAALTPSQRWVIRTRAFLWRWSGKTAQSGNSICWKKTNIVGHWGCWKSQHNPWFISDTSQKAPKTRTLKPPIRATTGSTGANVYQCQIEKWITMNFTAFCLPKIDCTGDYWNFKQNQFEGCTMRGNSRLATEPRISN